MIHNIHGCHSVKDCTEVFLGRNFTSCAFMYKMKKYIVTSILVIDRISIGRTKYIATCRLPSR